MNVVPISPYKPTPDHSAAPSTNPKVLPEFLLPGPPSTAWPISSRGRVNFVSISPSKLTPDYSAAPSTDSKLLPSSVTDVLAPCVATKEPKAIAEHINRPCFSSIPPSSDEGILRISASSSSSRKQKSSNAEYDKRVENLAAELVRKGLRSVTRGDLVYKVSGIPHRSGQPCTCS